MEPTEYKTIECPICKGAGKICAPKRDGQQVALRKKAANMLKSEGYSIREIMLIMGYKSPLSIQLLLKK